MKREMPNTAEHLARALATASGATGLFRAFIFEVLKRVIARALTRGLVIIDKAQVAIIVRQESEAFVRATDAAYELVDGQRLLTEEEVSAIDQPFIDAFIKLATFRVRQQSNEPARVLGGDDTAGGGQGSEGQR